MNDFMAIQQFHFLKWLDDGQISQRNTKNNNEDIEESTTEDDESEKEINDMEMDENLCPKQLTPIGEDIYQLKKTTPSCLKSTPKETTPHLISMR